ncbi:MAG TPA: hypothetical protein DCL44_05930 [Elusimicrobia bacterium]|nr:hypothetical protein [Elusimicrobiota bacterium]
MRIKNAFTLIELMIVVAIIGILAAVSTAKFSDLIAKSKDGSTKGALSSIRSTLAIYYSDNEGHYPVDNLTCLCAENKYTNMIPIVKLAKTPHSEISLVTTGSSTSAYITDSGGWAYVNDITNPGWGLIAVNCSHSDLNGDVWSLF